MTIQTPSSSDIECVKQALQYLESGRDVPKGLARDLITDIRLLQDRVASLIPQAEKWAWFEAHAGEYVKRTELERESFKYKVAQQSAEQWEEYADKLAEKYDQLAEVVRIASTDRQHDGHPVKYGEYDVNGKYIPPDSLPNIPELEGAIEKLLTRIKELSSESHLGKE